MGDAIDSAGAGFSPGCATYSVSQTGTLDVETDRGCKVVDPVVLVLGYDGK
jgi:hypothetical protein